MDPSTLQYILMMINNGAAAQGWNTQYTQPRGTPTRQSPIIGQQSNFPALQYMLQKMWGGASPNGPRMTRPRSTPYAPRTVPTPPAPGGAGPVARQGPLMRERPQWSGSPGFRTEPPRRERLPFLNTINGGWGGAGDY